jgi:hypothetical protein
MIMGAAAVGIDVFRLFCGRGVVIAIAALIMVTVVVVKI